VGRVTSATQRNQCGHALAFLKTRLNGQHMDWSGQQLMIGLEPCKVSLNTSLHTATCSVNAKLAELECVRD
jgi:hypothetical protein